MPRIVVVLYLSNTKMKPNKKKLKSLFIAGLVLSLFIFGAGCADNGEEAHE